MKSKIMIALVFSIAYTFAHAEKTMPAPQTEEQCKKILEKTIEDHKSLTNPTDPNKVADDSFVLNLKKLQQSKSSCEAYNQFLDSYN